MRERETEFEEFRSLQFQQELTRFNALLFRLFEPKKRVLKKAQLTFAFGKLKTQLFYKSCVLSIEKKLRTNAEGIMAPQGSINEKCYARFVYYRCKSEKYRNTHQFSHALISHPCLFSSSSSSSSSSASSPVYPTINKTHFNF